VEEINTPQFLLCPLNIFFTTLAHPGSGSVSSLVATASLPRRRCLAPLGMLGIVAPTVHDPSATAERHLATSWRSPASYR
jgi:hypothetical protein